ncbi:hypothetical protein GHT06_010921 [Daphnia sinensis]|uniref:C1q domain-containing protein n=1 Tax=Daphnia sinensis TaxID=1820382 RepID=A0AAD5PZJ9_9CRUS|nr:hypothetical protein GHT06_010921 [Daphnia sinensis]
MNNLATLIFLVSMASSVCAQIPTGWPKQPTFLSTPYYVYNHQVIPTQPKAPVLHQNDPFTPQRDATVSVLLRELKEMSKRLAETNVMVENVKKETAKDLSDLRNELAEMKKLAEGSQSQSNDNCQKVADLKSQAELLAAHFDNFTMDSDDEFNPLASFCNRLQLTHVNNTLSSDVDDAKLKLRALTTKFAMSTAPKTIGKIPNSCADLLLLGYTRNGIYSVMGNKQVESVYCDFTKNSSDADFQTAIGIVDTKTMRVSFHAQRVADYTAIGTTIPFDVLRTNEGDAMSETGIFITPTPGTYFFAFSGIGLGSSLARVDMEKMAATQTDWIRVGRGYASAGNYETFSFNTILRLNKGDKIRLILVEGKIHDLPWRFTNFVGTLLNEDL